MVVDYAFSPDHSERTIVGAVAGGVGLVFEGGAVTFGLMTQSSQAEYSPAIVEVPLPLAVGATRSGATVATNAGGGGTRTEDWTTKVIRQETITVAGRSIQAWVVTVDRQTRPGSADQVTRSRTYWYDPASRMWVRWQERFEGSRTLLGLEFGFRASYEATLLRFPA